MEPIAFKFKWVDEDGQEAGFRSSKGQFDGERLTLDDVEPIPVDVFVRVERRDNRLIFVTIGEDGEMAPFGVAVTGGDARQLKMAIDYTRSRSWAKLRRKEMEEKGEGHLYREAACPRCQSTIDLSRMPETPQIFCPFCDALSTVKLAESAPEDEHEFCICDHCGMFSKPRKFTTFYFYFLLVIYGWNYRTTWRCPACMRPEAWKMLFGNLLFVIGVIPAIVQLVRAYGSDAVAGRFAGLHKANRQAKSGDVAAAVNTYQSILQHVPYSAGVHYNVGVALMAKGQMKMAADAFQLALTHCANYQPAYSGLAECYEQLGETEKLAELNRQWGYEESDAE